MFAAIKTTSLFTVFELASANFTWSLQMAPRRQWEENMGYCGEVSTISALLYYGGYMSQYDMRENSALKSFHVQTASEYLLGVND